MLYQESDKHHNIWAGSVSGFYKDRNVKRQRNLNGVLLCIRVLSATTKMKNYCPFQAYRFPIDGKFIVKMGNGEQKFQFSFLKFLKLFIRIFSAVIGFKGKIVGNFLLILITIIELI